MANDRDVPRRVTGVLLAAGMSTRMATQIGEIKQLLPFGGVPMVRHVATIALASRLTELVVVVGYRADAVSEALEGLPLRFVHNAAYAKGLSASIRVGVGAVDSDAVLLLATDQPQVTAVLLDRMVAAYETGRSRVVAAVHRGEVDHVTPILFDRSVFPALTALSGDGDAVLRTFKDVARSARGASNEPGVLASVEHDVPLFTANGPVEYERLRAIRRSR